MAPSETESKAGVWSLPNKRTLVSKVSINKRDLINKKLSKISNKLWREESHFFSLLSFFGLIFGDASFPPFLFSGEESLERVVELPGTPGFTIFFRTTKLEEEAVESDPSSGSRYDSIAELDPNEGADAKGGIYDELDGELDLEFTPLEVIMLEEFESGVSKPVKATYCAGGVKSE